MTKTTKLVITDITEDHRQTFLDLADALELTRGQLLALMMAGANVIGGGLAVVFPDQHSQDEWRELMVRRTFELANL